MTTSSTAQIRKTLDMAFDDSALSAFCLDYFPKVYDQFSQGMRKDDKITYFVDYCRRQPTGFETLLENVRKEYAMSNSQSEQLKPLIDALSVYIDSSSQIAGTTEDGVGSDISSETERMATSKETKETIHIGNKAQIGEAYTGGKRQVNTGGGVYFEKVLISGFVESTKFNDLLSELVEWKLIHNECQTLVNVLRIPISSLTKYRFKPDNLQWLDDAGDQWQEYCVPKLKAIPDKWQLRYAHTYVFDELREQTSPQHLKSIARQLRNPTLEYSEFMILLFEHLLPLNSNIWDLMTAADKKIMVLVEILQSLQKG